MSIRSACISTLSLLVLASCDDSSSSDAPQAGDPARHPAGLVGSWFAPAGDYAIGHMVLRADGTGASVGVSGTRRDVRSIHWNGDDTLFVLSDSTGRSTSATYRIHGDTLLMLTRYILAGTADTTVFLREPEPSLVPNPGEHASEIEGVWDGTTRSIASTMNDDYEWVPTDTSWDPDAYRFRADGTGENISYEMGFVCDTLPLGSACSANGSCDSITTPAGCDPVYDGACSYTGIERCQTGYVPEDTTRFTWWTSKGDLYLGFWGYGTSTQPSSFAGAQVVGWLVAGDSLRLRAYFDAALVGSYKRMR